MLLRRLLYSQNQIQTGVPVPKSTAAAEVATINRIDGFLHHHYDNDDYDPIAFDSAPTVTEY